MDVWKIVLDSTEGTSHSREQLGCQDASGCVEITISGERRLCLVCSDGAGSAVHAAEASRYACQWFLKTLAHHFYTGGVIGELDRDCIVKWTGSLRAHFEARATELNCMPGDFACTLLLSVLEENCALFAQIGDGVIVRWDGEDYKTVFWPQTGEYLNTTIFVTSDQVDTSLNYLLYPAPVHELALLTDGLQMISLDYGIRQAHQPFFAPLFSRLRAEGNSEILSPLLTDFLRSEKVNARTNDDKTLILASRITSDC